MYNHKNLLNAISATKLNDSKVFKELCGRLRDINRCALYSRKGKEVIKSIVMEDGKYEDYLNELLTLYAYLNTQTEDSLEMHEVYNSFFRSELLTDVRKLLCVGLPETPSLKYKTTRDDLYNLIVALCCFNPLQLS